MRVLKMVYNAGGDAGGGGGGGGGGEVRAQTPLYLHNGTQD